MRKNNRKGFTIVELVIVIAVIAILAGVLIPTFAGITTKAKKSAALQEARNLYTEYLAFENGEVDETVYLKVTSNGDVYYFVVEDNKLQEEPIAASEIPEGTVLVTDVSEDEVSSEIMPAPKAS